MAVRASVIQAQGHGGRAPGSPRGGGVTLSGSNSPSGREASHVLDLSSSELDGDDSEDDDDLRPEDELDLFDDV